MNELNVFWFRRDLRLDDNCGLYEALRRGEKVLPLFIFDKNILSELPENDARVTFIYRLLEKMNNTLKPYGTSITIIHDEPVNAFQNIISVYNIKTVFTNHDYEPYARLRDEAVEKLLADSGIGFETFKDQVVFEKDEIVKNDGTPYVVFTPYSNKWLEAYKTSAHQKYPSETLLSNFVENQTDFPSLASLGFSASEIAVPDFDISEGLISGYENTRNFPSLETSRLSPHLRFGAISIRKIFSAADKATNKTFLKELIWREFFMQILWHFPETVTKSFRPKYDHIKWRNNEDDFKKWCDGKTGFPLVDAGMRELNATGTMHNRVRMVTASFVCKHLLIDWRWGEAYFALKLLDYEQSSNVGNWQWAAGSGVDAAPYFRIFNPEEQLKKFDKNLEYTKKWVPEFGTEHYPEPIVDHKEARERCLQVYRQAVG